MDVFQTQWTAAKGWSIPLATVPSDCHMALVFGAPALLDGTILTELRETHPTTAFLGCSTAGEICGTAVCDDSVVTTFVRFDSSRVQGAVTGIADSAESRQAGERLAAALSHEGLVHVLVLSDGLRVNGSALVEGLTEGLPDTVSVTGGLAGDGDRFQRTLVLWGDAAGPDSVAALGLYGDRLRVGSGSRGGWDPFGPERLITRSSNNKLFELDGKSALGLYKEYLGEHAKDLPASGLHFPLSIRRASGDEPIVRAILSIDEAEQSMTSAGDIPEGAYARLMKANMNRLIDGAGEAARVSGASLGGASPDLALLISCVARRLVLRQRVEEEVEGVQDVFGPRTVLAGFYSYGEICPVTPHASCQLHNQTMTITTFTEV